MKHIALLLSLICLISCTFSDKSEERRDKASLPTLILEDSRYIVGQKEENPIAINSKKIEFYSNDDLAILEDFTFEQRSTDGAIIVEGRASKGELNTYSRTLTLEGDVSLIQRSENMEIRAEKIFFNPDKEEVSADGYVMVKSTKGEFRGIGFFADLKEQAYTFDSIEEGSMAL